MTRMTDYIDSSNNLDPVEGRMMDVDFADIKGMEALTNHFNNLIGMQRAHLGKLTEQSMLAGRSISLRELKSHRRFEIGRGIILLINDEQYDEELVMSICSHITGQQYKRAGQGLADLRHNQAQRFADICLWITVDAITLEYNSQTQRFLFKENQK